MNKEKKIREAVNLLYVELVNAHFRLVQNDPVLQTFMAEDIIQVFGGAVSKLIGDTVYRLSLDGKEKECLTQFLGYITDTTFDLLTHMEAAAVQAEHDLEQVEPAGNA